MKLLDLEKDKKSRVVSSPALGRDKIGRIPESQIRGLDNLHQTFTSPTSSTDGARRRPSQNSTVSGFLTPQVTGDNGGQMTSLVGSGESDRSSIVSCGDRAMETGSSDGQGSPGFDKQKFRLPDRSKSVRHPGVSNDSEDREASDEEDFPPPSPPATDSPIPTLSADTSDSPMANTTPTDFSTDIQSYFNPFGLQRTASIYSLSRVSFSDQLSQLTSLQLPQASSLRSSISAIPTSQAATKALTNAAEQIRRWIQKSSDVLSGLNAEDDVEWAAAGGREGVAEVQNAVTRFEKLIEVYVGSIEELQLRKDIGSVPKEELQAVVSQMDKTLKEWEEVRKLLRGIKAQVEIAMEWEELWGVVLGDIGLEMQSLSTLVFEMEEKRHRSLMNDRDGENGNSIDIGELETIVEETPAGGRGSFANHRLTLPPVSQASTNVQDDSSLLALFARMQPLRASLDFLPMRLSSFVQRAEPIFPTACEELESRRQGLEKEWKKLETDAEGLRRELGEDRWVLVFRNAGRQAQKMCESVARSLAKLQESIDAGIAQSSTTSLSKKVDNYEAKKTHYGPAIERVLAIIEKGLKDRLTVNGEILRLHSDMQARWKSLESDIKDMDSALVEYNVVRSPQLRDSISSIISLDRSASGSLADTPGSSPASSVVLTGNGPHGESEPSTPGQNGKSRTSSITGSTSQRPGASRRQSSMPQGSTSSHIPRKTPTSKLSGGSSPVITHGASPPQRTISRGSSFTTPTPSLRSSRPSMPPTDGRPRWSSSVNTNDLKVGHNFAPLTSTTPSPHRKIPVPSLSASSSTKIPHPTPKSHDQNSPMSPSPSVGSHRLSVRPSNRNTEPSPSRSIKSNTEPSRRLKTQASASRLQDNRRNSSGLDTLLASNGNGYQNETEGSSSVSRPKMANRPASAMASGRRGSLLPQPKGHNKGQSGRESPMAMAGAKAAMGRGGSIEKDAKPRWR
jgi:Yeast cortical protein KAR9